MLVVIVTVTVPRLERLEIGVSFVAVLVVELHKELRHAHPAEDQLCVSDDVRWVCVRRDLKTTTYKCHSSV